MSGMQTASRRLICAVRLKELDRFEEAVETFDRVAAGPGVGTCPVGTFGRTVYAAHWRGLGRARVGQAF